MASKRLAFRHYWKGMDILRLKQKIIEFEGIGPVLFHRSLRASKLIISIRPFKDVRVAIPKRVSMDRAIRLLNSRLSCVHAHHSNMKQLKKKITFQLEQLAEIDRRAAREFLVNRLTELAEKSGFKFNRVFIRQQKTRWGSCSEKNNINLNVQLVNVPRDLMDYVIMHELVHTRIKNHGPAFWRELARWVPDPRAQQRRLSREILPK